MVRVNIVIVFLLFLNSLSAQTEPGLVHFDNKLNEFLNVRDFCISRDADEAFFTLQSPSTAISQIAVIKKENNDWFGPELLPFCDGFTYLEPFLSSDGNRLFFASDRPLDESSQEKKDFDIWYVDRLHRDAEWSEPKNMGKPVNSNLDEFYPTLSDNNNLYFTMDAPDGLGKDDIYFSKWEDGHYSEPVLLNENINSDGYEFNAFISKKEDFLIFTKYNEKDGHGSGDLYISKKDKNGEWQKATNMGLPINSKYMEFCPFYDENNQLLYFTSRRETITPKKFKDITDFKSYIQNNPNGLSKIYSTSIKLN
ncbi:TolB-like translocation protein [Gelidibacter maritimus]|uniref:PD40 domain-containing protein n=1 Tax=Gelidibacter maritimus TaxID=2761487 RepID=A0A7W2M7R1_9FLAO|nr:PD40 domain-containing protein [Gelidibacter maritimus]MBA6154297.1 PD40 domain-containing protein [Gelidibacter maritimus]